MTTSSGELRIFHVTGAGFAFDVTTDRRSLALAAARVEYDRRWGEGVSDNVTFFAIVKAAS